MENVGSALEQFRQQWKLEVSARARSGRKRQTGDDESVQAGPSQSSEEPKELLVPCEYHPPENLHNEAVEGSRDSSARADGADQSIVSIIDDDDKTCQGNINGEPMSALEHFETAVEKEDQGNLGDSLSHYRKAYRLDAGVDLSYRQKHFPAKSKPDNPNPSNASATVPSTAHHSSKEPTTPTSTSNLIASFANLPIIGSPPLIEGHQPPPCPIRLLPSEILFEVLLNTAILDPASFSRLAMVCKRLAYHVFVENQIWKRVALGPEFGLASQLYEFRTDLSGREAITRVLDTSHERPATDNPTFQGSTKEDWREVFHTYPRIRFTGIFISTVNYTRSGGASATQTTWNTPVHIVTYYRYLRFFPDGTVISLLTTYEPIEVVHHLTKDNMTQARGSKEHHPLNFTSSAPAINGPQAQAGPTTAHQVMKHALRGRWRLGRSLVANEHTVAEIATAGAGADGDLFIETEGAGPRYMYTMQLALKSSSKSKHSVKNNKLQWKGFWSYNQLTNDWAPFQLKNDRPFFFSRVKSYGLGY